MNLSADVHDHIIRHGAYRLVMAVSHIRLQILSYLFLALLMVLNLNRIARVHQIVFACILT